MTKTAFLSLILALWVCTESTSKAAEEDPDQTETSLATTGTLTIKGTPVTTVGQRVDVGHKAPDFTALDGKFQAVGISQFRGRPILISRMSACWPARHSSTWHCLPLSWPACSNVLT